MSARSPERATRGKLVATEVLERAAAIFAERGLETSLQEIADALGISRPLLYHYFDSKQDLITKILEDLGERRLVELRALRKRAGVPPSEKIAEFVRSQVHAIAASPARFRLVERSHGALAPAAAERFRRTRKESLNLVAGMIDDGIRSGEFAPVNPRVAALGVFGTVNWIAFWYQPEGDASVDEIADTMVQLTTTGLSWPDGSRADGGVPGAVQRLKQSVAYLEQVLGPADS